MQYKLEQIVDYLNKNYNQDNEEYSIANGMGDNDDIIRYDEETAISFWACGAIVCIEDMIYFIQEDDGYWFCYESIDKNYIGLQNGFNIAWAKSFADALLRLKKYADENGTPVYYANNKKICHYKLKK